MKSSIKHDQQKQAGSRFWLLGKIWHGKRGGGLVAKSPEGDLCASPVRNHGNRPMTSVRRIGLHGLLGAFLAVSASAQTTQNIPDVTAITLEDLMNLQVTSVSKRAQKLADAAAAIFVITQDDIRRSGASSIPAALRMVPGLQLA